MRKWFGLVLIVLTGCSAGGGASGGADLTRAQQAELLEETLKEENVSEPSLLPDSGSVDYVGFMTARLPTGSGGARKDYLGDLTMSVDFDANQDQVTGRANGFAAGNDVLKGALRIRGGDLFRDTVIAENYTFTGLVDGTLRQGDIPYIIDAEIEGEFRGRNQIGVSGLLFGDVVGPDGQDIFDGDFYAGRAD